MGINTYYKVDKIVEEQYNKQQLLIAKQISSGVEEFLDEKVNLVESIAVHESNATPDEYQKLFKDIYEGSEGFYALEFINTTGIVVTGYPHEIVPVGYNLYENDQIWPIEHAKETGTYCTNPMELFEGGLGSFIWVPVYEGTEYKGTILGIIRMSTLTEKYLEISDFDGCIYMLDRQGQIIFESSDCFVGSENSLDALNGSNQEQLLQIIHQQLNGSEGTGNYVRYNEDGKAEEMMVAYTPIHWNRRLWTVAVASPVSRITTILHYTMLQHLILVSISGGITLLGGISIIFLLFRWNKSLECEVERKTNELKKTNESLEIANMKLKELDTMKSDFISMASHELKTPLTAIKISAESLMTEDEHEQTGSFELLEKIIRNVDRQTRLVNELMDITKIELGMIDFGKERVDMYEVIETAVETVEKIAYDHGIAIKVSTPASLSEITGNKDALMTVFVNLINNAIKFTSWGGRIEIDIVEHDENLEVTVKDNGIGIPQDDLEHIFEKFYKLGGEVFQGERSTGLGLAIVKTIVEGHQGVIRAESKEGVGTCFIFTLGK
ncbi:MAG: sensor histidine kinase [ANME-2 cluster archaeon]|nr:sensor histidine kinase [ANME-2 cluster archaeon]